MAIKKRIVGISTSPTKVLVKQQTLVSPKNKFCVVTKPTEHPDCSDPGPAGFDFSEDEAERVLTSYRVF